MRRILTIVMASSLLVGCSSDESPRSVSPEPSVTANASGVVSDAAPNGQTDRFVMDVETSTRQGLGPSLEVVYDRAALECSSGATPSPDDIEAGDSVTLIGIGDLSEKEPTLVHPRRVQLDC